MGTGKAICGMVMEFKSGPMVQGTKAIGWTIRLKVKAHSTMWTVTSSRANGEMTRLMATETTFTPMEQSIKVTGRKIYSMEKATRHGLMEVATEADTVKEEKKVKELTSGLMAPLSQAAGLTTKLMDMAFTPGTTVGPTKVSGKIIKCTARAFIRGLMAGSTKVNI